jgi:hypothetical protein
LLGFDEPSSADLHAHVLIDRPEDVCEYMIEVLVPDQHEEGQPATAVRQYLGTQVDQWKKNTLFDTTST